MNLTQVAPPRRATPHKLPRIPLGDRWVRKLLRGLFRLMPTKRVEGVNLEVRRATPAAPALRIDRPEIRLSDAALLWLHGDGYVIGSALQDDPPLQRHLPAARDRRRLRRLPPRPRASVSCTCRRLPSPPGTGCSTRLQPSAAAPNASRWAGKAPGVASSQALCSASVTEKDLTSPRSGSSAPCWTTAPPLTAPSTRKTTSSGTTGSTP